jgi:cation:H+ antiporter
LHPLHEFLDAFGLAHPLSAIAVLIGASLLVLWRVEAMLDRGLEGTALGTLVLPYCSGLGNLLFVVLMLRDDGAPVEIIVNSVVNNATNLTLLLGIPALAWGLVVVPSNTSATRGRKSARRPGRSNGAQLEQRLSRLSLLLTLSAVGFFTGAVWLLGQDGRLDRWDGVAMIGLFLFWQCFQVFDTLKHNLRRNVELGAAFFLDVVVVVAGAWLLYESLEWIVNWLSSARHGFFRADHLGWITGWLLVLPNALVALFYAARGRADIVYSSQIGDGHICIPLCVGLCAVFRPVALPPMFQTGMWLLLGTTAAHAICLTLFGRLPKPVAALLVGAYGWFVYAGLLE